MAVDERRIERFLGGHSLRSQVADVLQRAGFEVVWVDEEGAGSRWGLYLKLSPRLRSMFGTCREVLIWVVQSSEFQARSVTQAAKIIVRERPRLCEDFAIILTHDPKTAEHADETAETLDTIFLGWSLSDFLNTFEPFGTADLLAVLRARLYSRDLYNIRTAVTKADEFFGRKALVTDLSARLRMGGRHVGLFGLRKVGKTSLLYRLQTLIRGANAAHAAHVDIERIDSINPTTEYFLWSVGESVVDANRQLRGIDSLALFGRYNLYGDIPSVRNVPELFHHDMKIILQRAARPLILIFDEIELMSPSTPGSTWGDSFVRAWRLLRGLDQEMPGKLSFLVSGTNPAPFEMNRLDGKENPVYNYFDIEYLRPLAIDDASDLLVRLGSRMGLDWEEGAARRVHRATGGHPGLLRAFGSMVHRNRRSDSYQAVVELGAVEALFEKFLLEESTLLSNLISVLEEHYPSEHYLLETLAQGRIGEFREMTAAFPEDVAHLVGYGLAGDPANCSGLNVELLQTFLQRRLMASQLRESTSLLSPGQAVASYVIERAIGRPGGFARVYAARTSDGDMVALKVFDRGSLGGLQRELEPLQSVQHPSVVKVLDYGQTQTGTVYMAMEFLEGETLKQFCTRSTRAQESQVVSWLRALLGGLKAIHPDASRVDHYRRRAALDPEDFAALMEARHGFVHRDVKPENIVLVDRGPVLIDFNISVRASSPVRTVSATPGYLPPNFGTAYWDPGVDLYQLGLTMLQVAVGIDLSQGGVADLKTLARTELSANLANFLLRLSSDDEKGRFSSARSALSALPAVSNTSTVRG